MTYGTFMEHTVSPKEEGKTIEHILRYKCGLSRRLFRTLKWNNGILLNGQPTMVKHTVSGGDKISLRIKYDNNLSVKPEKMELDIVYEDDFIIAVNKWHGIVTHPCKRYLSRTLANGVAYLFKKRNIEPTIRIVGRLDKDTSGLVLISKDPYSHIKLMEQMGNGEIERKYLAVVHGKISEDRVIIDSRIRKDSNHPVKSEVSEYGKESLTELKVIKRWKEATYIEVSLGTGRTHQIRVHLANYGVPIIGDRLYGVEEENNGMKRQALHAYRLRFKHPRDKRWINLNANIPEDMERLVNLFGKNK